MKHYFLLFFLLLGTTLFAQKISGKVISQSGDPLQGAYISIENSSVATISDIDGNFSLENVNEKGVMQVSFLGYKSFTILVAEIGGTLQIVLDKDYLNLEEVVVTGTLIPISNKNLSVPISTITPKEITTFGVSGSAALLARTPGVYVDASAGEVFTRVYTRGISISAEDDLGWYYVGLQEDGLPVSAVQFSSFSPDLFHRIDNSIKRVEVVRGGSAAISGMNSPGGVFNFISNRISKIQQGAISLNTGVHNNGNFYNKIDATISGPLSEKFGYSVGVSHRLDQGNKNIDFNMANGGQLKLRTSYTFVKGKVELYGKYLDDHVNRTTGVTANNWKNPEAAYDQDFKSTAQLISNSKSMIPDGVGGYYEFDPSNGIHTKDITGGFLFESEVSENWKVVNHMRYSSKSANWQTSLSSAKLPLNGFLPYFISGAGFPVGQVIFDNAKTGQEMARVNNAGIFGDPPSFDYLTDGTIANDAVLGVGAWYKDDHSDEFMNQLSFQGDLNDHILNGGVFIANTNISTLTRASFAYASYAAEPTAMTARIENPGAPIVQLSDENGYSNYGGLFYGKGEANVNQLHLFVQDQWKVNDKLMIDAGLRWNSIVHFGSKDRAAPLMKDGGYDGNPLTDYDNGILISTGEKDGFDYSYNNFSYSLGVNYEFNQNFNLFGRFSKGEKAPELDYYFDNFSNVPINEKGPSQQVTQVEAGIKFNSKSLTIIPTLFYSELSNVGFSTFVFDEDTNAIFYTPMQFNSTETFGLEIESIYHPTADFNVRFNGTLQNAKAKDFTVYNANGTIDTGDDEIIAYNGNKLPFNPSVMFNLTPEYTWNKTAVYADWRFMGEREGNIANAFQLPSYSVFNFGAVYKFTSQFNVGLHVKNAFASEGLLNFYGPNSFGASKDDATKEYISNNPNADFIVTPVQARLVHLNLNYTF